MRAGAVTPMWPEAPASTAGHHPAVVELHVSIPGADGRFLVTVNFATEPRGVDLAGAQARTGTLVLGTDPERDTTGAGGSLDLAGLVLAPAEAILVRVADQ